MRLVRRQRALFCILLAVMLAVQFAGSLASPWAEASVALDAHHRTVQPQHVQGVPSPSHHQPNHHAGFPGNCCALHAIFLGIIAQAAVPEAILVSSTRLVIATDVTRSIGAASRIDRPPRARM